MNYHIIHNSFTFLHDKWYDVIIIIVSHFYMIHWDAESKYYVI